MIKAFELLLTMASGNECADYKNLKIFVDSENSKYVEQKIITRIKIIEKVFISLRLILPFTLPLKLHSGVFTSARGFE